MNSESDRERSQEASDPSKLDASKLGLSTIGVHGVPHTGESGEPVVPPIVQSATFYGGTAEDVDTLRYTRYGNNPNQLLLAEKMAELEGTEASVALASGQGGVAMTFLALVDQGDHVVASPQLYGATRYFLEHEFPRRGVETSFVDPMNIAAWREALRPNTRLFYLETPTNPTLRIYDPEPIVAVAREVGIPVVMDATFASPVNLRPADRGVDVVIHSATKYLGGHSDLIAGVVSGPADVIGKVRSMLKSYGPAIDPHAAWLLDRGLRTLAVRMKCHNRNAHELAEWLEGRDEVDQVIYPGLSSHPDHTVAKEILSGFGGMLALVLKGGGAAADTFAGALRLAKQAPSLGGVETLVSQPRFTSHVRMSAEERTSLGIPDGFVRVSVGIEDPKDLKRDFERGLEAAGN